MKVKELKEFLNTLPDEMPIGLWDQSTDDFLDGNYPIKKENLHIDDWVSEEGGEAKGKALFITFDNHLNENPIT